MKESEYREYLDISAKTEKHKGTRYKEFVEIILKNIRGRCLEIGCGDGVWTDFLRSKSSNVVSIDLSKDRIKNAKKIINNSDIDFIISDARVLPFKDRSFSTICAFEVIEHLPNRNDHFRFIREVKRLLSKNGVFLISTPNRPLFIIYCWLLREMHPTHFSELSYSQLKSILSSNFRSFKIYGQFGWLHPFYRFKPVEFIHRLLSKFVPVCKGLLGVCKQD
ncbi:MAG: class I SAM-dependent methyltransferase [Candidatus Omnitrophota bacterium]